MLSGGPELIGRNMISSGNKKDGAENPAGGKRLRHRQPRPWKRFCRRTGNGSKFMVCVAIAGGVLLKLKSASTTAASHYLETSPEVDVTNTLSGTGTPEPSCHPPTP